MPTPPASQARRNARQSADFSPEPRPSDSARVPSPSEFNVRTSQWRAKRRTNKQQHLRGSAKAATLDDDAFQRTHTTSPRHIRNRKGATRAPRPADRSHTPQSAETVSRPVASASLPSSSPAKDLLRRARATAAVDTDWLGRRPFIMDLVLGNQPVVPYHSEDAVLEAIELSEAALGPARGVYNLEDYRSLELYWEAQAANLRWAAGDEISQHRPVPEYELSAERSTVTWPGDDDAESPPSNAGSSPP